MLQDELTAAHGTQPELAQHGPFVLKTLLKDVPLSADGEEEGIVINCVEYYDGNLYVGTSAAEILHFVEIPPDPSDEGDSPSYILASRLSPSFSEKGVFERLGVQQILLLLAANKACVLCNSTVTFYSLPELTPAFGNQKVPNSNWIGGLDLNRSEIDLRYDGEAQPVITLLSTKKKIQSVKIGEEPPRVVKSIDFAGCVLTTRRDNFACVADTHSYSLLDVERQLKINLFPISSLDTAPVGSIGGRPEDVSGQALGNRAQRSTSSAGLNPPQAEGRGHGRSTSLGTFMAGNKRPDSRDGQGRDTPDIFRESSPAPGTPGQRALSPEKALQAPPNASEPNSKRASMIVPAGPLKPHIASPSPEEFLLVIGTAPSEPGVGMFVNLEGEVTRSTLEFDRYPEAVVTDGRGVGTEISSNNAEDDEEGYVLAVIRKETDDETHMGLEIQRWDVDHGESASEKFWVELADGVSAAGRSRVGIRTVTESGSFSFDEVVQKLRLKRFRPHKEADLGSSVTAESVPDLRTAASFERQQRERQLFDSQDSRDRSPMPKDAEEVRAEEELQFAKRLGRSQSRIAVWSGDKIFWSARNPLALRLDAQLEIALRQCGEKETKTLAAGALKVLNSIRGQEARTELEYISLGYIRQRAALFLLTDLLRREERLTNGEYKAAEEASIEGSLDPRVVLALSPSLRDEIIEGKGGIWIPAGVHEIAERFFTQPSDASAATNEDTLQFYRHFLMAWRKKKGFGSIADEDEKIRSVDAALILVLLRLDEGSGPSIGKLGSPRADLYDVVDHGVDCFERAVAILEAHHRLYVLSRLYQSRKLAGDVLATWRRIIEGEHDAGGEFTEGEQRVKDYLTMVRNAALVEEYGVWLASRNPKLGVQVFADDRSRVTFYPKNVVSILRAGAPGAVKEYLEYLVFGKGMAEYGTELIAYYLDIVLHELETSSEARDILALGYETYRALSSPKPTYRQFILENGIDADWWRARLRLLQLLGGSQEAMKQTDDTTDYDFQAVLDRIEPYREHLVPELIILDGRQGRHTQALKLLVHGLGDYDTAINYCLVGGSSMYHPISGTLLSPNRQRGKPAVDSPQTLFDSLLTLFLTLPDETPRLEQTANLLSRFGFYFDVLDVLARLPEEWTVAVIDQFLTSALRRLTRERHESMVVRALRGAENLKVAEEYVDRFEKLAFVIEDE